jgi:hypothetical protein
LSQATEEADLVWGADEIARIIKRDNRATYHLLSKGVLPVRKIGGRYCGSRRKLLAFLTGDVA